MTSAPSPPPSRAARSTPVLVRVWAAALVVLVLCRALWFTTYRVAGSSMVAALLDGDRILVGEVSLLIDPLAHGELIVFEVDDEVLVKRVVACPGDRIAMVEGALVRNGAAVPEQIPPQRNRLVSFPEYRMGGDEYFLLGDNRRVSIDSRDFGPVRRDDVLGKVFLRFTDEGLGGVSALATEP